MKIAPDSGSTSYFTGSLPSGISITTLTSHGGLKPEEILSIFIDASYFMSSEKTIICKNPRDTKLPKKNNKIKGKRNIKNTIQIMKILLLFLWKFVSLSTKLFFIE